MRPDARRRDRRASAPLLLLLAGASRDVALNDVFFASIWHIRRPLRPSPPPPSPAHTRSRRRRRDGGVARGGARPRARAPRVARVAARSPTSARVRSRGGRRSRWRRPRSPRPPCGWSRTTHRRSTRRTRSWTVRLPRPPRRARARASIPPPRETRAPREPSTPRPPRPSRRHPRPGADPTRAPSLSSGRACVLLTLVAPRVRAAPPRPPSLSPPPSRDRPPLPPSLLPSPAPHDLRHVLNRRRQRALPRAPPRDALRRVRDRPDPPPDLRRDQRRPRRAPRHRRAPDDGALRAQIAQTEGPPRPGHERHGHRLVHPERAPVLLRLRQGQGGGRPKGVVERRLERRSRLKHLRYLQQPPAPHPRVPRDERGGVPLGRRLRPSRRGGDPPPDDRDDVQDAHRVRVRARVDDRVGRVRRPAAPRHRPRERRGGDRDHLRADEASDDRDGRRREGEPVRVRADAMLPPGDRVPVRAKGRRAKTAVLRRPRFEEDPRRNALTRVGRRSAGRGVRRRQHPATQRTPATRTAAGPPPVRRHRRRRRGGVSAVRVGVGSEGARGDVQRSRRGGVRCRCRGSDPEGVRRSGRRRGGRRRVHGVRPPGGEKRGERFAGRRFESSSRRRRRRGGALGDVRAQGEREGRARGGYRG